MQLIISNISSIFLIIAVGFIANKIGIMPISANKYLVNLLIKVTCPCMVLASITTNELAKDTISITIQSLVGSSLFLIISAILGYFLAAKVFKVDSSELGVYAFSFGSVNNGFIGFPITEALFGSGILYLMVIHNVSLQAFYLYSLGPVLINMGAASGAKLNLKGLLGTFKNPNTVAAIFSIILLIAELHLPQTIFDCVNMIGSATTPLSMLIVGMQLGECEFKSVIKNSKLIYMSVLKMILLPVLTFLAVNWLPMSADVKVCLIFAASFPVAVAVVPIISDEDKDSLSAAEMVAVTTLISLAVIPLTATFLMGYYGV